MVEEDELVLLCPVARASRSEWLERDDSDSSLIMVALMELKLEFSLELKCLWLAEEFGEDSINAPVFLERRLF